ncbi:sugar transferase [Shimia litoralis]|uniref:sugar transferase n=1 Tax=Shimia litoralis TaxID=420403 RepID=UPI002482A96C|nr:sugar transferase [Shimia litoralis]
MFKRVLDIFGASLGLLLFSPLLIFVAWQIRGQMGAPVLFRQTRSGRDGKPFQMVKFRTMRDAVDADGTPCPMPSGSQILAGFCGPVRSTNCPNCGTCSRAT